jgi:hypothetical protein
MHPHRSFLVSSGAGFGALAFAALQHSGGNAKLRDDRKNPEWRTGEAEASPEGVTKRELRIEVRCWPGKYAHNSCMFARGADCNLFACSNLKSKAAESRCACFGNYGRQKGTRLGQAFSRRVLRAGYSSRRCEYCQYVVNIFL